eukprot:s393_g6.t1
MAVVVCHHCKAAQKMSFWELHTRLAQCYEEETSHSQNSHHYHHSQEHGPRISGSGKSFEHPGMASPGYGLGQEVPASHSHNVLLSAVKHEEHELITPSGSGRRRQSVGRANFHPPLVAESRRPQLFSLNGVAGGLKRALSWDDGELCLQ